MNVFELVAKLTLDSSEYDRGMMAAKGSTATAGGSMVSSINKTKKAIGVAAVAMGTAIAAFGVSSIKANTEFDTAMSQVAATMGKTKDEMNKDIQSVEVNGKRFTGNMTDYAKMMGKTTRYSATESAEALNYMALAGYDTATSMQMLPNVMNLASAGAMDLATASDMITDTQTAFGLSLERTNQLVDEMAKAASTGNTSVEQLGNAFLTVGGLAKELNGGMITLKDGTKANVDGTQELEIALTAMANAGIKGSEAGTHMRNMLMKLSSPTAEGTKQLEAMGVAVFDSEGKMRSLKDIMGDLDGAMSNMTQEQKLQAISDLFNARDLSSAEALLSSVEQDWDGIGESILNAQGAAQQMSETQLDNLGGDITLLKSAFDGLKISIGEDLTPVARDFVQFLTDMIDHADTLIPIILGVATAVGVFAIAINIGNIIKSVTTAMAAFNAVLVANPIGIVVALIAGLVVAITLLWKKNENFRNKVTAIWNSIKAVASSIFKSIKNAITHPIQTAIAIVKARLRLMKAVMSVIFNGIKAVATSVWNGIKSAITSPIQSAVNIVKKAINKIKGILKGKLSFPKIKLPKFSIKGKFSLAPPSVPSIGITWHAEGGIFTKPTLLNGMHGVGEAGSEAVLPLSKLWEQMDKNNRELLNALLNGSSNGNINLTLQIDGRTIAKVIAPFVRDELKTIDMRNNRKLGTV